MHDIQLQDIKVEYTFNISKSITPFNFTLIVELYTHITLCEYVWNVFEAVISNLTVQTCLK